MIAKKRRLNLLALSSFLGFGDWRNKVSPAALLNDLLGRLSITVKFPVKGWVFIGIVEDRMLKEWVFRKYRYGKVSVEFIDTY